MLRPIFGALSPAGPRGRLTTLIFHRVVPKPDPLFPEEVDAASFDRICAWIKDWFNVVPLDEAVRRLQAGTLPARALAITFDDGYEDNASIALPILRRHGLSATFFVATGFLDGGRMWNDTVIEAIRRTALQRLDLSDLSDGQFACYDITSVASRRAAIDAILPKAKYLPVPERLAFCNGVIERAGTELPHDLMMTSGQVRELHRAGMQIGAHTVNHPILAGLPSVGAHREIADSKAHLEAIVGQTVSLFAYPNGRPGDDYEDEAVAIVRDCGFDAAMSTVWGAASNGSDLFQLPRFTPWDRSRRRFGLRLAANFRRAVR